MSVHLEFGLRKDKLYHVSEVEFGLECNCICPSCKAILVAKKGEIREHHFAHHRISPCPNGAESAMLLLQSK